MKVPYQPVSCELYDQLTDYAVLRRAVKIIISLPDGGSEELQVQVKDIITRNKEEFLITENDRAIRLDQILSVMQG